MTVTSDLSPTTSSSWWPVDLRPIVAGAAPDPSPVFVERDDGKAILYAGRIHTMYAEPESMKSWFALMACTEIVRLGGHVLVVDFEDSPVSHVARLRALGAHPDLIVERVHYIRPHEQLDDEGRIALDHVDEHHAPLLVVIDGVNEALGLFNSDLNSNLDYARWLNGFVRPLSASGAAVLLIDHVIKAREARGRGAIGAQHKLAGVDVALALEIVQPFGKGRHGISKIWIDKDRPGHLREIGGTSGKNLGELHLESDPSTGAIGARIEAPRGPGTPNSGFRPTVLMDRIAKTLTEHPNGLTGRAIRTMVSGKNDAKALGLELLISEGFVTVENAPRGASIHRLVKGFQP